MVMSVHRYSTTICKLPRGRARVPFPLDPNLLWGPKVEHHISGTVGGCGVRGTIARDEDGWSFSLGPAWLRDAPVGIDDVAAVEVAPEGPQRDDLAPDLAEALQANPAASEFFDGLAQFYRKAFLRWIDATKRRPEVRADRIVEVVALLAEGVKERPKP